MISESQINKENKNIVKLKQVKEYFNNILTTFLSNIKLDCNNINSLDYLDSNLKIFGNEVNDIIRDLVNINKEIIESIPSIPSPIKQVHKVNEEINNKKEFFEKWKEFVKINKLKRKYFQKWRKLVEKKIEERHKVNEDINKKQMSYFKNLIKSSKNGDSRTKNTIQTYGYDWRNAIKNFYPNRNLNINEKTNFQDILNKTFEEIMETLNKINDIKKRKRVLNIIIVLKTNLKIFKDLDILKNELKKLNQNIMGIEEFNIKTEKQKTNWITLQEYGDLVLKIEQEVVNIFEKEKINKKDRNVIQEYIILRFYQLYPLRNDLAELIVIKKKSYLKLSKDEEKKNNYLIINSGSRRLILNNYKTKKHYKQINIILDTTLIKVIRKFHKLHDKKYLLINLKGEPLTRNTFSIYFRRMMKKYTDKSIGSSLLRHIVITEKMPNLKTVFERRKFAEKMLHSMSTQRLYVKY